MTRSACHRFLVPAIACMVLLLASVRVLSQDTSAVKGKIEIIQDDRVALLVSKHVLLNMNREGIAGFRIQIFFDSGANSKSRAQSIYSSFQARYPETPAYLTYKAPNYKVRIGDFRTKLDARRFLNSIIAEYPNAWIVEDMINFPNND